MLGALYRHHHGAGTADRLVPGKLSSRLSLSESVGSAGFPTVTFTEFFRVRLSQHSFSGVITSLPEHLLVEICELAVVDLLSVTSHNVPAPACTSVGQLRTVQYRQRDICEHAWLGGELAS